MGVGEIEFFSSKRAIIRKNDKNSPIFREIYSKFITFCNNFDTLVKIISKFAQFFKIDPT